MDADIVGGTWNAHGLWEKEDTGTAKTPDGTEDSTIERLK